MKAATILTTKLEKEYKDNIGVRKFTGDVGERVDLRQYESWYDTDTLQYLTHTLPPNPDVFRYIFTLDSSEGERQKLGC
jgi:hypothetical protein